jgi:hypothetical protein
MTQSANSLSLGYSHVFHKIGAIRIPRLPRLGLARLFIDAIEAGVKAQCGAHLVALGMNRATRGASQEKNDY